MVRNLLALLSAIVVAGALVSGVAAAPKESKTHQLLTIDCGGEIGEIEVLTGENSVVGFASDGEVFVAKRFHFEATFTVTTFDDVVFGPFPDEFSEGSKGKGFEGRLIECTFPEEFTDAFILDEESAEFFGMPEGYIGTEVTIEGSSLGTVWVIDPGK